MSYSHPETAARHSLMDRNAPTVRRRLAVAPAEVNLPHARAIFNRSNGRFRCECGRVHAWGRTATGDHCRALKCWCEVWHLRRDVTYTRRTP